AYFNSPLWSVVILLSPQIISTGFPLSGRITNLPSRDRISSFKAGRYSVINFHKSNVSATIDNIPLGNVFIQSDSICFSPTVNILVVETLCSDAFTEFIQTS